MSHVFISYVREDQTVVDRLCADLKAQGVTVWLDRDQIMPGIRWKDAIRSAIQGGSFFLACFSSAYRSRKRTYMNAELTLAIEQLQQYATDRVWFIPALLDECDVPARSIGANETLLDLQWIPLYKDWEFAVKRILDMIKPEEKEKAKGHLMDLARRMIIRAAWVSEQVYEDDLDPDDDSDDEDPTLKALEKEYWSSVEAFHSSYGERFDPYANRFP